MTRKFTLRDVAQEARVSVGTVSHYLNNPESVKPINRLRIESAIDQLNFTPNVSARSLASGKSRNIMLFVLSERIISPTTWLHQLPVIQTVHDMLNANGFSLQVAIAYEEDYDSFFAKVRLSVESGAADGILFLSVWKLQDEMIDYLVEKQYPFVCLDNEGEHKSVDYVCFDQRQLMNDLFDEIYGFGHRNIAYVGVRSHQQDMYFRFKGYCDGLRRHGLVFDDRRVLYGDFSIESGKACVAKALDEGFDCTAILCGNDNMAVGALEAIVGRGMDVPRDMSLVGVDNSIAAKACTPHLQTAEFDMEKLAKIGVQTLLKRINRGTEKAKIKRLKYKLINGATLGPVRSV